LICLKWERAELERVNSEKKLLSIKRSELKRRRESTFKLAKSNNSKIDSRSGGEGIAEQRRRSSIAPAVSNVVPLSA
jgi:hypothetical protein